MIFGGDLNLRDTELAKIGGVPPHTVDLWEVSGKRKEAHYNYLSCDMQCLRSTKAAVAFLTNDPRYTQQDIDNLLKKSQDEGKRLRPDKYDWLEGVDSVPQGWKVRMVTCSNGLVREFFLAPDGSSCSGKLPLSVTTQESTYHMSRLPSN